MAQPKIMVCGYGSWPTAPVNPCAQVVGILKTKTDLPYDLHAYEIPVISSQLYSHLETLIDEIKPDVFIGLGVAVRYTVVKVETLGINKIDLPVPDAAGNLSEATPVVANGPIAYQSNLPNQIIISHLKCNGIPAIKSYYAGTHMCNQMLYTALHLAYEKRSGMRAGFLHLPQATENIVPDLERIEPGPSMPLTMLVDAVLKTIECTILELDLR